MSRILNGIAVGAVCILAFVKMLKGETITLEQWGTVALVSGFAMIDATLQEIRGRIK